MDNRRKTINITKIALFILKKVPSLTPDFDSQIKCAIDDLDTALFEAKTLRKKEIAETVF